MSARNVEAFRQLAEAADAEDIDRALTLIAEDVEWIAARSAVQGAYRGHDGIRAFLADNQESFEVYQLQIDEVRDLGDELLVLGSIHLGGKGGGVETDVPMAAIATYRDGRLVRWEDFRERDRALRMADFRSSALDDRR